MAATANNKTRRREARDNYLDDTYYCENDLDYDTKDDTWDAQSASGVALFKLKYMKPSYKAKRFAGTKLPIFEKGAK